MEQTVIRAIDQKDYEEVSVEWLIMASTQSPAARVELVRRAAARAAKKSIKHLGGLHDQLDHGNWATGGVGAFAAGKWSNVSDPSGYQSRIAYYARKYALSHNLPPDAVGRAVIQYQKRQLQEGVKTTANGNVIYRSPSDRVVALQTGKGGSYNEEEWLKRIEAQMARLPNAGLAASFPIDVSWKSPGTGTLGKWSQSGVKYEDAVIAASGGVLQFSPMLMSEDRLTSTEPTVVDGETLYGFAVAGVPYADYTVAHEFGHVFSSSMASQDGVSTDSRLYNVFAAARADGVDTTAISDYGKESISERYAESYVAYQYGAADPLTLWLAKNEGWAK
jgi:hypothetical protein